MSDIKLDELLASAEQEAEQLEQAAEQQEANAEGAQESAAAEDGAEQAPEAQENAKDQDNTPAEKAVKPWAKGAAKAEVAVSAGAEESRLLSEADEHEEQTEGIADKEPAQPEASENGEEPEAPGFDNLGLSQEVLQAVKTLGFESPTPIQEQSIPVLLKGRDIIGKAQTGTGKTAAFALPILSLVNTDDRAVQALVLEPTRELALQVSEAVQSFAKFMDGFRVAPIYGGASYENQIRSLRHGAQVVVGTPGRLIDLIERGKLDISSIRFMVIDEADEMLRMGFIDDVDWILSNTPDNRQTALFSATMPPAIARIAKQHLKDPEDVEIKSKTATAVTVHQRYWVASGAHKIDAMTRILEVEPYDAVLVFVRTKTDAEDVANKLMARGFSCAALHGDIPQRQREKIIERVKSGLLDIIIATDVAARGLDVDRITHVFNYDIPYDAESYVHRIGRTGRAGRQGEAILFVSPRERRALRMIENMTHQKIEPMAMPTAADVNKARLENFKNQVLETIGAGELEKYEEVISEILADDGIEPETLAAALAKMCQRDGELFMDESKPEPKPRTLDDGFGRGERGERGERREHRRGGPSADPMPLRDFPDMKMQRFRVAVGRRDGAKPGQIVGAIANEGNIESRYIGEIDIFDSFSTVDLPEGMPEDTMKILAQARVCGRPLDLRLYTAEPPRGGHRGERRDFEYADRSERRPRRSFGDRDGRSFDRGSRRDRGFGDRDRSFGDRDRNFSRRSRPSFGGFDGRFRNERSGSRSERGFTSARSRRREDF
ncbi:MAG: DEAD/DEAH box helicase [Succinivibrio sp.]|jgi:ATP-dependent RNA helicase DeaD|nr:DEAD/DEAH box helicase [Succinivibrio sp.]